MTNINIKEKYVLEITSAEEGGYAVRESGQAFGFRLMFASDSKEKCLKYIEKSIR